jgi:hypothetical protein
MDFELTVATDIAIVERSRDHRWLRCNDDHGKGETSERGERNFVTPPDFFAADFDYRAGVTYCSTKFCGFII